jgi:hypothetical protein
VSLSNTTHREGIPTPKAPDAVFVEETSVDIYKVGQNFSVPAKETADWVVNVTLSLRSAEAFKTPSISLLFAELNLRSPTFSLDLLPTTTDSPSWVTVLWHIPDSIPQRWYPHNLGTPKLYNLTISLNLDDSAQDVKLNVRTGFRTVKLAQLPYSQEDIDSRGITPGDQWHFEINGKAFYSLGTNIIPFDPFYPRINPEHVRWVLESAVRSGQNTVSVSVSFLPTTNEFEIESYAFGAAVSISPTLKNREVMICIPFATSSESLPGRSLFSPTPCTQSTTFIWNPSSPKYARMYGVSTSTPATFSGPAEMRLRPSFYSQMRVD